MTNKTLRILTGCIALTALAGSASAGGEETYKAKCVNCHGADGSGGTPMGKKFKLRDLRSADVQKRSDDEIHALIANGKMPMPAYSKTLDEAKVTELVAYVRSLAAK